MKISSSLNKDWHYDDAPHYWESAIDPTGLVTWKDIEYCLNNPNQFDIKFINKFVNQFIDYPKHERAWDPHAQPEVRQLMDIFAEGHTCIIEKFEYINHSKKEILKDLEETFNIHASMHVFCGLGDTRSFNIHEDYANNLIIQVEGETHWTVYKNRASNLVEQLDYSANANDLSQGVDPSKLEVAVDVNMKPGDIIYIPARTYHRAQPKAKRLSLSIPMQHLCSLNKVDRNYYALPS